VRVDTSVEKGAFGTDNSGCVIDKMNMKLGSKFLSSLRIKTQLLKRHQGGIVVDGATHSQKDGVEGNGGSLKDGAEAFMLFLHSTQLCHRKRI
jgi:aspartate carbamoyltransferase regulatory subunit